MSDPICIAPSFHEKIWGSTGLSPWFPNPETKTGEVWFDGGTSIPLIKFLFTTDRLSVQVHPEDGYAAEHESSNGKTEMWHVLRAAPGAQVAIGFRHRITEEQLRESALDGSLVALLNWIRVRPGDTFFVPAGTVHAIGAGLALCEIQQHSNVTYRLYDYDRPRELHLDRGVEVSSLGPCVGRAVLPVRSPYFSTERYQFYDELRLDPLIKPSALIVLDGEGLLGSEPFIEGQVWQVEPETPLHLRGNATILRTWIPQAEF